jgi:hypothetical protein
MSTDWQKKAACAGADWRLFFTRSRRREALEYCDRCEAVQDCLDDAMTFEEDEPVRAGIRGGVPAGGRKALARARRRTAGAA